MITITFDVLLIPLIGIGNVICVCLAHIAMNTTTINWATMTFQVWMLC